MKKRVLACILACLMFLSVPALAATVTSSSQASKTASYVKKSSFSYGSDEFLLVGLVKSGNSLTSAQKQSYQNSVKSELKSTGGTLSSQKNTVYARTVLGLTATGADASSFNGYDVTKALKDVAATAKQGINGCIWALIALDSGEYAAGPDIRKQYVDKILEKEISGGGFAISGSNADPDVTAMALVALSRYQSRSDVAAVIKRGLSKLSSLQQSDGTYKSYGTVNAESTAQVIVALCALNVSLSDSRFVKNGKSALDGLLKFSLSSGAFAHTVGGEANALATEQGLLALAAANKKTNIYRFASVTFSDMTNHEAREASQELSRIGVLNGFPDGTFQPNKTLTRAEFATMIVRILGLSQKKITKFKDVPSNAWYAGYVGAAYSAGIIKGCSDTTFQPEGTITVVEAKIMLARAAKRLGVSQKEPAWTASSPKITRGQAAIELYALADDAGKL